MRINKVWSFLFFVVISQGVLSGQECSGVEIRTAESYLYGRFEVKMRSAPGDGIVSSFFLYNKETNCNWPAENNEIDIEMTGDDELLYFTTHHPDPNQAWFYGEEFELDFNPHTTMQDYAIEWEPGIVRWLVEDEVIYVQEDDATKNLKYPMAIFMNLWVSDAESWVGEWNPAVLPQSSEYEHVKYYEYAPGQGNYGSNNNFKLKWEDNFEALDTSRWEVSDFRRLGVFTTFRDLNLDVSDGKMTFLLDEPHPEGEKVPVTFSINMQDNPLNSSDRVFLNGAFNNWCGGCNPMSEENGIWKLTLELAPGKHEYLFTVNEWSQVGSIELNSDCDFKPCDEFGNYGVYVKENSDPIVLDTQCWQSCSTCQLSSVSDLGSSNKGKLLKVFDISGKEVMEEEGKILFYLYENGSVEKRLIIEH